jgi:uncharacterized Zn finger protein (UPF0148 family)
MPPLATTCPHCSQPLTIMPSAQGKTIICPNCRGEFGVVVAEAPAAAAKELPRQSAEALILKTILLILAVLAAVVSMWCLLSAATRRD